MLPFCARYLFDQHNDWVACLALYRRALAGGLQPAERTYTTVLRCCARHGQLEEALAILQEMRVRSISATGRTYREVHTHFAFLLPFLHGKGSETQPRYMELCCHPWCFHTSRGIWSSTAPKPFPLSIGVRPCLLLLLLNYIVLPFRHIQFPPVVLVYGLHALNMWCISCSRCSPRMGIMTRLLSCFARA